MEDTNHTVNDLGRNAKSTDFSYVLEVENSGDSEEREGSFIVYELK